MNKIKHVIGTAIGVAMVVAFAAFILALVLSLASEQLPAIKTIWTDVRCLAGFPEINSACVREQLAELRLQRLGLEEERERILGIIGAQRLVFTQGKQLKDGISLVVGTLYQDGAAQAGLLRSFCWAIVDNPGLDPRVGLAVKHADGRIKDADIGAAELALLGISGRAASAARAACPFPVTSNG
jgi:hypothetical protein